MKNISHLACRSLALLTLLLSVNVAVAETYVVNSIVDAPDATPGDGLCATASDNRVCTLRAALQESYFSTGSQRKTIWVPAGIYQLTIPVNASAPIGASGGLNVNNVTLQGAGREATVIDAGAIDTAVIASGDTLIADLTIRNGRGVLPDPTLYRHGGGIYNNGKLTLHEVIVRDNVAGVGAGIANGTQGTLLIEGSTITANTALMNSSAGAGIYNYQGTLIVRNSTISDNRIEPNSGGTEFSDGSGLTNQDGAFELTNVTISGNQDGAIYSGGTHASTLSNVTIAGNAVSHPGAAVIVIARYLDQGGMDVSAAHILKNSIIADNSSWNCSGHLTSGGYNIDDDGSCNLGADGTSSVADPRLGTLAGNGGPTFTHWLSTGSPAIDAGDPSGCTDSSGIVTTDQRGGPRAVTIGGGTPRCDIGAFELGAPVAVAGVRQRVRQGTSVLLDGRLSRTYSGQATHAWTQVGGDTVTINRLDTSLADFIAPATTQPLTFEVAVTDNTAMPTTGTARVTIEVNSPPVANAGNNFTVLPSEAVTLNGTGSQDADGRVFYAWTQTAGPAVTLSGATTASPKFNAPASGPLTFQLTVTDADGLTDTSSVTLNVVAPTPPSSSTGGGGGGGGGGALGPLLLAALGLLRALQHQRRVG